MYALSNGYGYAMNFGHIGAGNDPAAPSLQSTLRNLQALSTSLNTTDEKIKGYNVVASGDPLNNNRTSFGFDAKNNLAVVSANFMRSYMDGFARVGERAELFSSADLRKRIDAYNATAGAGDDQITDPRTYGTVANIQKAANYLIAKLGGDVPAGTREPDGLSTGVKIALVLGVGAVVVGGGYLILRRRR